MDFLDIIIPKKELETVKLKEKLIAWGEGIYFYEPSQYVTDSDIIFEEMNDIRYLKKMMGKKLEKDAVRLTELPGMQAALLYIFH